MGKFGFILFFGGGYLLAKGLLSVYELKMERDYLQSRVDKALCYDEKSGEIEVMDELPKCEGK